jgi:alpha-1,6-mannosyltransferase
VWNGDRARMADEARAQALQFSWDHSMEVLFGEVHPAAFARRAQELRLSAADVSASFAKA